MKQLEKERYARTITAYTKEFCVRGFCLFERKKKVLLQKEDDDFFRCCDKD